MKGLGKFFKSIRIYFFSSILEELEINLFYRYEGIADAIHDINHGDTDRQLIEKEGTNSPIFLYI